MTIVAPTRLGLIGTDAVRLDAVEKVSGKALYGGDQQLQGMLYAKVFRSSVPHARIRRLDVSKARELHGVRAVLTAADVADVRWGGAIHDETVFARDRVRYHGEAIAAVAAVSEKVAEQALGLIEVDYEPLPVLNTPEEALAEGAPLLHPGWESYYSHPDLRRQGNVFSHANVCRGDVDAALARADRVFEDRFETQQVHQGYIEPRAGVAWVDAAGQVTVSSSTQNPFNLRAALARVLQLPLNKVRVRSTYIGGGFGGKLDLGCEHFASLLALETGRPVRYVWTREEEMLAAAPRMPATITITTGVMDDGTIVARRTKVVFNAGAYAGDSPVIASVAALMAAGVYRIENVDLHGVAVYTNRANAGAYRGPSGPQTIFAVESHMDVIASALGFDPLEFRLRNIVGEGDLGPSGQVLAHVGLRDAIDAVVERIGYHDRERLPGRGVGLALCWWTTTTGSASCYVKLNEDGTIGLITGATEIGTGAVQAGVAQILAHEMGVDLADLVLVTSDTDATPYDFGAQGSRTLYNVGNAVRLAADDCKRQMFELVAKEIGCEPGELELADRRVSVRGEADRGMTLAEIGEASLWKGGYITGRGTFLATPTEYDDEAVEGLLYPAFNEPTFHCHAAEVEVDELTGEVSLLRYVAAQDCGYAVNPEGVRGQIRGGAVQGIGQALGEEIVYEGGYVRNPTLTDYKMPTSMDFPDIEAIVIESGSNEGPYGAKGVGEPSIVPPPAAIANAVAEATGVRVRRLPLTPERVFMAVRGEET
ncbi:MAG: xanthine dehydrogenase family protein molybdopterin-binding subunit [Gaiellaceae bacterium]